MSDVVLARIIPILSNASSKRKGKAQAHDDDAAADGININIGCMLYHPLASIIVRGRDYSVLSQIYKDHDR